MERAYVIRNGEDKFVTDILVKYTDVDRIKRKVIGIQEEYDILSREEVIRAIDNTDKDVILVFNGKRQEDTKDILYIANKCYENNEKKIWFTCTTVHIDRIGTSSKVGWKIINTINKDSISALIIKGCIMGVLKDGTYKEKDINNINITITENGYYFSTNNSTVGVNVIIAEKLDGRFTDIDIEEKKELIKEISIVGAYIIELSDNNLTISCGKDIGNIEQVEKIIKRIYGPFVQIQKQKRKIVNI